MLQVHYLSNNATCVFHFIIIKHRHVNPSKLPVHPMATKCYSTYTVHSIMSKEYYQPVSPIILLINLRATHNVTVLCIPCYKQTTNLCLALLYYNTLICVSHIVL